MSNYYFGSITPVTPSDTDDITLFRYIQAGVSGSIVIESDKGVQATISSALIDKMSIVPIGRGSKVLATGTTATDIYVWS